MVKASIKFKIKPLRSFDREVKVLGASLKSVRESA